MTRATAVVFLCVLILGSPFGASAAPRGDPPKQEPEQTQVSSPLQFIEPLGRFLLLSPMGSSRIFTDTGRVVCDKVTVEQMEVGKRPDRRGKIEVFVRLTISASRLSARRIARISAALVSGDKTMAETAWKTSPWNRHDFLPSDLRANPRDIELKLQMSQDAIAALYANEGEPILRVVVEVRKPW